MVELEYGMEFEYLFGVPDKIPDITRSSGMVRRIRFIYRKSYSKFGNDPVHLWQVLEGSRKVRKQSLMSTHAFFHVDSVGPPRAEVCRTAASFPLSGSPKVYRTQGGRGQR